MDSRPILLVDVPPATELKLRAALPEATFQAEAGRVPVRGGDGGMAVVWMGRDADAAFRTVRELSAVGHRVILVGPQKDADLILRAMREGAGEFVVEADEGALALAIREQSRPPRAADAGAVYSVFAAKGGVGATTIATNLAATLQRHGKRTCLIDLDLNLGDVLAFLDLGGGYSLSDVLANMRRLDRDLLDASLLRHSSGVHVLAQSHRVEEADVIDGPAMSSLLTFLRQHYDAIVIDGLHAFDELALTTLDASESVLLVVTQEVPAVRNARRCLDLFRRLGRENTLKLVVNRYARANEITTDVITDTVGLPIAATIANDYPAVVRAVNKGILLTEHAPRAQVTRELDALVSIVGVSEPAQPQARKSILHRFFAPRLTHAVE
jgi:pilus assembly protein CpaE